MLLKYSMDVIHQLLTIPDFVKTVHISGKSKIPVVVYVMFIIRLAKGFYMSVNVGYAIGWGYPSEENDSCILYSIFHVLVGSSVVAASLALFAQDLIISSKYWLVGFFSTYIYHQSGNSIIFIGLKSAGMQIFWYKPI